MQDLNGWIPLRETGFTEPNNTRSKLISLSSKITDLLSYHQAKLRNRLNLLNIYEFNLQLDNFLVIIIFLTYLYSAILKRVMRLCFLLQIYSTSSLITDAVVQLTQMGPTFRQVLQHRS